MLSNSGHMPLLSPGRNLRLVVLATLMSAAALLPWVRNHDHLREFYDYGLFIAVNARLEEGQKLFTDIVTPGQSASFLLNYAAEHLGAPSYLHMTYGAAALIVAAVAGLSLVLARRWPPLAATLVAGSIVICSASQHTIIFYNPLGVVAMALTTWSFAVAPVWRRTDITWHVLGALGLFLGGVNKISFSVLACAMAGGWVVHACISQKPATWRVLAAVGLIVGAGIVLPVAFELSWTGTDLHTWYYNVVQSPLAARGGRVALFLDWRLYLTTLHDYYGENRISQTGLVVFLLPLLAAACAWRAGPDPTSVWRRWMVAAAGFLGGVAALILLITSNEIAHLTVASSLVITVALWLGFGLPARGTAFLLVVLLPAALLGVLGWESAWRGQRALFGNPGGPRESFVSGDRLGPDFTYLKGMFIPPALGESLVQFAAWRHRAANDARPGVFYGPGLEWLERIWPARKIPGLPPLFTDFLGEGTKTIFREEVLGGRYFGHVLVSEIWDHWEAGLREEFDQRFFMKRVGPLFLRYDRLPDDVVSARPLDFLPVLGGNIDSTRMRTDMRLHGLSDGRRFLGTTNSAGRLMVDVPVYLASAEAVLKRATAGQKATVPVRYEVYAVHESDRYPRWSANLSLPEGVDELSVPTGRIEGGGLPMEFSLTVPADMKGQLTAGWRKPELWDTPDQEEAPPALQPGTVPDAVANVELRAALLPPALTDANVIVRNAYVQSGVSILPPGAELWIHPSGLISKIEITARTVGGSEGALPRLQMVYYKGGRIQWFHPKPEPASGEVRFSGWSPGEGGWFGVLADPNRNGPAVSVTIDSAQRP